MITLISETGDQKLSILDFDASRTNVRYKAVINDDQLVVLHLQTVGSEDSPDVSQLSLCPGVLESEILPLLSQSLSNTLVCVMFLIEKLEDHIVYRSRSCYLLNDQRQHRGICLSCQELLSYIKTNADSETLVSVGDLTFDAEVEDGYNDPPDFVEDLEAKAETNTDWGEPVVMREELIEESQSKEEVCRDQHEDYLGSKKAKPRDQKKKSVFCHYCPRSFISQKLLVNHANKQHGLNLPPPVREFEMMKCPFCEERFVKYSKYRLKKGTPKKLSPKIRAHLIFFHPDKKNNPEFVEMIEKFEVKKFICGTCGRCFTTNPSLESHMVQTHGVHLNTVPCHLCGKFFKEQSILESHVKTVHEKNPCANALCGDCGQTFRHNHDLQEHQQRVHSDQTFRCNECGKEEKSTRSLRRHIRLKHTGRERGERCVECEKSFYQESQLRKHISDVHHKLKPFYCEGCQFQSARLDNLNLHRRKSHNRQDKMTKALLLSMVENDEHPFYTRDDLEMIRAAQGHYR